MIQKTVYECSLCGRQFDSEEHCLKHERGLLKVFWFSINVGDRVYWNGKPCVVDRKLCIPVCGRGGFEHSEAVECHEVAHPRYKQIWDVDEMFVRNGVIEVRM